MKRKKSHNRKKQSVAETSPEALAETWKIVEEELRASGFQVCMKKRIKTASRGSKREILVG